MAALEDYHTNDEAYAKYGLSEDENEEGLPPEYFRVQQEWRKLGEWQRNDAWFGPIIRYLESGELPASETLAYQVQTFYDQYVLEHN